MNAHNSILIFLIFTLASSLSRADSSAIKFSPPRTADGHVNFEGSWDSFNLTPLERPAQFTSLIMSEAEARLAQKRWIDMRNDMSVPADPTEANELVIEPIRGELHTSLIIDPPDGRIPGTEHFKHLVRKFRGDVMNAFDHPEQRPGSERCLTSSAGGAPLMTIPANNLHQIVQTANAIAVSSESMHEARIIRLSATHPLPGVTAFPGYSIGWWENNTLVVETRNFKPGHNSVGSPSYLFFLSNKATVTERFTLLGTDELGYVFTVEDPTYYTRPWTSETRFRRSSERMFEYACHEGNYAMGFMLQAARAMEAAARGEALQEK